jgi:hypothetical protein
MISIAFGMRLQQIDLDPCGSDLATLGFAKIIFTKTFVKIAYTSRKLCKSTKRKLCTFVVYFFLTTKTKFCETFAKA